MNGPAACSPALVGDRVQVLAATGIAILAALLAGAVLLVLGHPGTAGAALFGLSVVTLLVLRSSSPPAVDAVLMTGLLYLYLLAAHQVGKPAAVDVTGYRAGVPDRW